MLTTRLKDDNWALHQIAERQETPGSLIKGTMPKDGYIAMLKQQWLINRALDAALAPAIRQDPAWASWC
ncbi:MAG: biliverdin-producing heme oxygenase [Phycisphaerales bacterium]